MNELKSSAFVYGTLKNSRREGLTKEAEMRGARLDETGTFPTVVPDENSIVRGQILGPLSDGEIKNIDSYESEGYLYYRIVVDGIYVYVGHPEKLRAESDYEFDRVALEEAFADVTITPL